MAQRTTPPFRADHVGSLLRPPHLLRARADHAAGTITAEQLRAVEDDAIRDVVRLQEGVGLHEQAFVGLRLELRPLLDDQRHHVIGGQLQRGEPEHRQRQQQCQKQPP